jgi:hypothetical protein
MSIIKSIAIGVVVMVGIVLVLAVTCPDEDSFDRWATSALAQDSRGLVDQAKGTALSAQARWTADYENHVLWATVDAYQGGTERRFLGVVGTWFRLGDG